MAPKLCMECKRRPKWAGRHRCQQCHERRLGIVERLEAADARLGMVPPALRVSRVPNRLWPDGQRWCAGCQSFRDLEDFGKGASQCKACTSRKTHAARVQKVYGIDAVEYARLLALQGGKCAICRRRPGKRRLAVDHNHQTGAVRGLLCESCNHDLLGGSRDTLAILKAAVGYMETPPASGTWTAPEAVAETSGPASPKRELVDVAGGPVTSKPVPSFPDKKAIVLAGGGKDSRGMYRLYVKAGDTKPPF